LFLFDRCSLTFGYAVCTATANSGHGMIWSIYARNCARRAVLVYFSNPVSVCGFFGASIVRLRFASERWVDQTFRRAYGCGTAQEIAVFFALFAE
jgi:hypothetical protein